MTAWDDVGKRRPPTKRGPDARKAGPVIHLLHVNDVIADLTYCGKELGKITGWRVTDRIRYANCGPCEKAYFTATRRTK